MQLWTAPVQSYPPLYVYLARFLKRISPSDGVAASRASRKTANEGYRTRTPNIARRHLVSDAPPVRRESARCPEAPMRAYRCVTKVPRPGTVRTRPSSASTWTALRTVIVDRPDSSTRSMMLGIFRPGGYSPASILSRRMAASCWNGNSAAS
jgi:hypothetical protein